MKFLISLITFLAFMSATCFAGQIQQQGFKTQAQCTSAGVSFANCLLLGAQVWDETNGQPLSTSIASGIFSGGLTTESPQSGSSYTLALADKGKLSSFSNAGAVTVTVPNNTSVAFPVGAVVQLISTGAGGLSVAAASGVTIKSANGTLTLSAQYSQASLVKTATNSWYLFGGLTVSAGTGPRSEVSLSGGTGVGSTNVNIRRFATVAKNVGTDITYAASSTLGDTFTANSTGIYCVTYSDYDSISAAPRWAITVNDSAISTPMDNTQPTYAQGLRAYTRSAGSSSPGTAQWCGNLSAGDVVRAHTDGTGGSTSVMTEFTIVKVSN